MVNLIQLIVLILLYLNILLPIVLVDGIKVLVHLWCHVRFLFEVAWVLEVLPLFRLLLHHSQLLFGRWICLWGDWRQWLGSDEIFRLGYRSHCRSPCHVFDLWIRRVFFCWTAAWADRKLKHIGFYFHFTHHALLSWAAVAAQWLVKIYILIRPFALTDLSSHLLLGLFYIIMMLSVTAILIQMNKLYNSYKLFYDVKNTTYIKSNIHL